MELGMSQQKEQQDSLDIRQEAEKLILSLWAESDRLRERAEGVRLFLQAIISESERINGQAEGAIDSAENQGKE